jgi:hypothetical protein
VLSVTSDDSTAQTVRIFEALAAGTNPPDLSEWLKLQAWLQDQSAEERATIIPFASALAKVVPPVATRLRRDFAAILSLIRSCAILHQKTRERDGEGRIVASFDDYEVVSQLVAPLVAEAVGHTVSLATRETVEAVEALAEGRPLGVTALEVAKKLGLHKSNVSRRLSVAGSDGWLTNLEDRKGRPGRWIVGAELPGDEPVLPSVDRLRALAQPETSRTTTVEGEIAGQDPPKGSGCAVARESEGQREPSGKDIV